MPGARITQVCLSIGLLLASGSAVAAEPPDEQAVKFFETSIRPILVAHCNECHGPEQQWASLRLDSRDAILKGGENGPAIVPGKPEESLLIEAVRQDPFGLSMPPESKLTDQQIADLVKWIAAGAVFPPEQAQAPADVRANHWSFQPIADPAVPSVSDTEWPTNDIDRFILEKLEAAGLQPASTAEKRILIRRVTFDLTGLPPSPAEVEAFVADDRPDAYARLVDRLLASPEYGERWGRHWLDVARYADSNGLDENIAHGNAWRYRDYVVEAFNGNKPYDEFVKEQIAGDLLEATDEADRRENLTATGFLVLGPKVLAEVDKTKMEMDIIDEQLDTLGRAMLGMTFGCARCHDHKFDPISAADYYALAGIFKSTTTMESFKTIARWNENVLPGDESRSMKADYEQSLADAKDAIDSLVAKADANLAMTGGDVAESAEEREKQYPQETKAELKTLRDALANLEKTPPDYPAAMGVAEGTVSDLAIHMRGSHLRLGNVVPRRVPDVFTVLDSPTFPDDRSGRRVLADWMTHPENPLTSRVIVNRIWRWHFGHGLVRTPDNFGLLGEEPTHPELLDWLARRFVEDGWSIKQLHRDILLSSTYRQSDRPAPGAAEADPENRLYSRWSIRRLEAEEIRDSLLATGRQLDREVGGSLLTVKNRAFFFDHTSIDKTEYDTPRRSLYLPIVRNNLYNVLGLLDYPDPAVSSGDRPTTTVAPQALLMMNSPLVIEAAAALEQRLTSVAGTEDDARLDLLYLVAYSRLPSDEERAENITFLETLASKLEPDNDSDNDVRRHAWSCLCQIVLASNEFVYVR